MAVRIHVVAARNTSPGALRQALALDPRQEVAETNGWAWTLASVWHVDGRDLDKGLKPLRGPALRATTSDGVCWRLHLFAGGKETFRTTHYHSFLDDEAWEELEEDVEGDFDEIVDDLDLPEALVRRLKRLPFAAAMRELVQAHAALIADALSSAGIPHEREAVLQVLRGENVPEAELATDLGNLPRFLSHLGLEDLFPQWAEDDEDEEEDDEEDEEEQSVLAGILGPLDGHPPVPLEGGPVTLPLADLPRLWLIPWFCDTDVGAAVTVVRPGSGGVPPGMADEQRWVLEQTERGFGFAVSWQPYGRMVEILGRIAARLRRLPDGSVVELVTANEDEEHTAGNQRFRGVLRGDEWRVEAAYPPVDADALRAALDLAATVEEPGPFLAASEEEAEAVVAAAERSDWFNEATLPRQKVRQVYVGRENRPHLALMFFRQRFRDAWNVAEGEAEDEESRAAWDGMMDNVAQLGQLLAVPTSDEIVLEGRAGTYRRASVENLPERSLSGAFEALFARLYETEEGDPPTRSELAAEADRQLAEVGFAPLGDMVCDRFAEVLLRGYASETAAHVYGVLLFSGMGEFYEFYTAFEDGSSLTTTTVPDSESDAGRLILKQSHPGREPAALLALHAAGVEKRLRQGHRPLPATPTLRALAEAVDEFLVRAQ